MKGSGRGLTYDRVYYPGICVDELRKSKKNLNLDIQLSGRDMNPGHPEYEARDFRSVSVDVTISHRFINMTLCKLYRVYTFPSGLIYSAVKSRVIMLIAKR